MSPSALTSANSAIVMIDHATWFGNVFHSHDLALHVNTLQTHQVAVQRMIQAGVAPVTWLSVASQYQRSYTNHQTVPGFLVRRAQVRVR